MPTITLIFRTGHTKSIKSLTGRAWHRTTPPITLRISSVVSNHDDGDNDDNNDNYNGNDENNDNNDDWSMLMTATMTMMTIAPPLSGWKAASANSGPEPTREDAISSGNIIIVIVVIVTTMIITIITIILIILRRWIIHGDRIRLLWVGPAHLQGALTHWAVRLENIEQ